MLVKVLVGRAGAERGHADEDAVGADDLVPALPHGGFDADAHLGRADDGAGAGAAGASRNNSKQGTDTTRADTPRSAISLAASTAIETSEPVAKIETSAGPPGPRDLIGAGGADVVARQAPVRSCGRFWRVSASTLGRSFALAARAASIPASRPRRTDGTRADSGSRAAPRDARPADASGRLRRGRSSRASSHG